MRLIDADKLLKTNIHIVGSIRTPSGRTQNIDAIQISEIENAPTIDAVPVVHGKWIGYITNSFKNSHEGLKRRFYLCSVCRTANAIRRNYCPNCGAKMDGDEQ